MYIFKYDIINIIRNLFVSILLINFAWFWSKCCFLIRVRVCAAGLFCITNVPLVLSLVLINNIKFYFPGSSNYGEHLDMKKYMI